MGLGYKMKDFQGAKSKEEFCNLRNEFHVYNNVTINLKVILRIDFLFLRTKQFQCELLSLLSRLCVPIVATVCLFQRENVCGRMKYSDNFITCLENEKRDSLRRMRIKFLKVMKRMYRKRIKQEKRWKDKL